MSSHSMTGKVRLSQHLYGSIGENQVFQTLFYSHEGISPAEAEEIADHLRFYPVQPGETKHMFFRTSSDKLVLSSFVSLKQARDGGYLAHSVVFPAERQYPSLNPAVLAKDVPFIRTLDSAFQQGTLETRDIPPLEFKLSSEGYPEAFDAARGWATAELQKLALLALRSRESSLERRGVVFIGTPDEVLDALAVGLLTVPPDLAGWCSFDTDFRGRRASKKYWAVGLPPMSAVPAVSARVIVAERRVELDVPAVNETLFERWAMALFLNGKFQDLTLRKHSAYRACTVIEHAKRQTSRETVASGGSRRGLLGRLRGLFVRTPPT